MTDSVTVLAPAKINLGLKVLPQRGDGFHNLQSIFTTVGLFDKIKVQLIEEKNTCLVSCDSMELPVENTFTKSYKAFCVLTGVQTGVSVSVEKHIPSGGGLGGGSSDASSFIQSLNTIFSTNLSDENLSHISGIVGSDVYFFTSALNADDKRRVSSFVPYAAFVSGRGEKVEEIKCRNDYHVLLVMLGVSVSTKEAYALVDGCMKTENSPLEKSFFEKMYGQPVRDWQFVNDFTRPVCDRYPAILDALNMLHDAGADFADMSGSGSTVYGIFGNLDVAVNAKKLLEAKFQVAFSKISDYNIL